jgi:hypothetical protein
MLILFSSLLRPSRCIVSAALLCLVLAYFAFVAIIVAIGAAGLDRVAAGLCALPVCLRHDGMISRREVIRSERCRGRWSLSKPSEIQ